MDLCRVNIENLIKFHFSPLEKPLNIVLEGEEGDGFVITRHFLINGVMEVAVRDSVERSLETDMQFIRDYFSGKLKLEKVRG